MDGAQDASTMVELSTEECYDALASHSVGRMGLVVDGFPLIIPVNYVVEDGAAVIRTEAGTVLSHADQSRVTLQIDEFDAMTRSGWSVLLRGEGRLVNRAEQGNVGDEPAPLPWAPGDRQLWIRISAAGISGRRIVPGSDREWRLTSMAYL